MFSGFSPELEACKNLTDLFLLGLGFLLGEGGSGLGIDPLLDLSPLLGGTAGGTAEGVEE